MHIAPIVTKQWEPESDYERWVSRVVDENPELTKCEMVAGDLVTRCVFLRIGGQDLIVHLERTICETCGFEEDDCAVPDFGCGDSEYSAFISALPRLNCSGCNQPYERRMVIWQSNKTNLENRIGEGI